MGFLFSAQPPQLSLSISGGRGNAFGQFCCFGGLRRRRSTLSFISPQFMHLMQANSNSSTQIKSANSNDLGVKCEEKCIVKWSVEVGVTDESVAVVYLTGDPFELGCWDPDKAVPLKPSLSNIYIWEAEIEVPFGVNFKYNYRIKKNKLWSNYYRRGPKLSLSTPSNSSERKEIYVRDCWRRDMRDRIRVPLWDSWLFGITVFKDQIEKKSLFDELFSDETGEEEIRLPKPKRIRNTEFKARKSFTQTNGKLPDFKFPDFKEPGKHLPDLSILISEEKEKIELPKSLQNLFSKDKTYNSLSEIKEEFTEFKAKNKENNSIISKEKEKTKNLSIKEELNSDDKLIAHIKAIAMEIKAKNEKNDIIISNEKEEFKQIKAKNNDIISEENEKIELKYEPIEEPWYQNLVNNSPKIEEIYKEIEISEVSKIDQIIQEIPKKIPKEIPREIPRIPTKILINSSVCNMRRIAVLEKQKLVELILEPLDDDNLLNDNIYLGVIKKLSNTKWTAFVDLGLSEHVYMVLNNKSKPFLYDLKGPICDLEANFRKGTKIIVQVIKEENSKVTLNPYPQIKSRFWILKTRSNKISLSDPNSIKSSSEKSRLLKIATKLKPEGFGLIVQSDASDRSVEELEKDLNILLKTWNKILENAESAVRAGTDGLQGAVPAMLYRAVDQDLSVIYDYFPDKVESVLVDSPRSYHEVTVDLQKIAPELCERVELYDKTTPIFDEYKIEEEINKILRKKVQLPDGGYLVIEQTEAFVSIDVNSGGNRKSENPEKTSFEVNRAAAKQIARELRLRDMGGVIIVDFIDMSKESNKRLLYEEMEREVERDRSKVTISKVSSLGLMEITRERLHRTGSFLISEPCECCHATGRVEALETCYSKIEREIFRFLAASDLNSNQNQNQKPEFVLKVDKHMCEYLTTGKNTRLDALKRSFKVRVHLEIKRWFSRGQFELIDGSKSNEVEAAIC